MEDSDDGPLFESKVELREPSPTGNMARELIDTFKRYSNRTILVDAQSGRHWTGDELLKHCGKITTCLVRLAGVRVNDVVMTICDRNDSEVAIAIGVVLSGAALYPTQPTDGYSEVQILCELVQPQVLIINSKYHEIARKLCRTVAGMSGTRIVWIDNMIVGQLGQQAKSLTNGNSHSDQKIATSNGRFNTTESLTTNGFSGTKHLDENNNNLESNNEHQQQEVILFNNIDSQHFDSELIESIASEQIKRDEHVCTFMLTSGSTGRPKVVPSTHKELLWGLYSMISAATVPFEDKLAALVAENNNNNQDGDSKQEYLLPISDRDVVAGDLPLDHGAGLNIMFLSLWLGAKYIVMPSFEADLFWRAVNDYKITFSISSTTFSFNLFKYLKRMIDENRSHQLDLSSIRTITCCGAKLSFVELANEIRAHYPHLTINQSYGCTENGYIANLTERDAQRYMDSVGYLFPGIKAKIVDPNNLRRQLGSEERGELLIWSESLFKGYRCQPDVDAELIFKNCHDHEGLFYRTGDQAHFDQEGRLYVHGRFKDTLVLMGDWKIMPAELEGVVDEHPLVETSGVVGVPDPDLSGCHKPMAYVKLVPRSEALKLLEPTTCANNNLANNAQLLAKLKASGSYNDPELLALLASHIQEFVADRTAPAKHLTAGVKILEELPRVGLLNKIDRQALRKMSKVASMPADGKRTTVEA